MSDFRILHHEELEKATNHFDTCLGLGGFGVVYYASVFLIMDPLDAVFDEVKKKTWSQTLLLSFQIVRVVYGQQSTTPLYVFGTMHAGDLHSEGEEVVYELFSFIFWTLTIISLLKYASIVLEADDGGEDREGPLRKTRETR